MTRLCNQLCFYDLYPLFCCESLLGHKNLPKQTLDISVVCFGRIISLCLRWFLGYSLRVEIDNLSDSHGQLYGQKISKATAARGN